MKTRSLSVIAMAVLISTGVSACSRHNDAETAVPGGGTATSSTAARNGNASTAAQGR